MHIRSVSKQKKNYIQFIYYITPKTIMINEHAIHLYSATVNYFFLIFSV